MQITLCPEHMDSLQAQVLACWPNEACALLVGRRDGETVWVDRVIVAKNIAEDPARFFEVDPTVRIGLERKLRGGDVQIVAVFHSHPNGPAAPSDADARMVIEKHFVWLIAAASKVGIVELKAYLPQDDGGFIGVTLKTKIGNGI